MFEVQRMNLRLNIEHRTLNFESNTSASPRHRPFGNGGEEGEWLSGHCFELVAQRVIIATLETAFLPLTFARFDQVFQTPGPLRRGRSAFGTPPISLHPQLIFSLP